MSEIIRKNVIASGIVQGVCYRAFVHENAFDLQVQGWVRNLPDGSVEAELQGQSESVERLIDRMRSGPRMARVTGLEVTNIDVDPSCHDFCVRH